LELDCLVFSELRWFVGRVEIFDPYHDSASKETSSTIYPSSDPARLESPPVPPPPNADKPLLLSINKTFINLTVLEKYHLALRPLGSFSEVTPAQAVEWFYSHLGHVPQRALNALERARQSVTPDERAAKTEPSSHSDAPSPSEPTESLTPSNLKARRPGGRPPDTDPKKDFKIAEAWLTRRYATYQDLASALRIPEREVRLAIDRHRHRKSAGKPRPRKRRQGG
jgi:hypothetical protein